MSGSKARWTRVASLTMFLVVASGTGALAHNIYNGWLDVWSDGARCLNEKVSTDHPAYHPDGLWMVEGNAEKPTNTPIGTINCNTGWVRPANWLREWEVVKFKLTLSSAESVCMSSPQWTYNNVDSNYMRIWYEDNAAPPPCGAGYYHTRGNVQMSTDSSWASGHYVGGPMENTEWHYLPV